MARAGWNDHTPQVVGVEFMGIGGTSQVIQSDAQTRALRFNCQQTGTVNQIAVYSGPRTNNPQLNAFLGYSNRRRPWIIDIVPVSGFDPGPIQSTIFTSTISSSTNVVDEVNTAPEGNELAARDDGLYLRPGTSSATPLAVCSYNSATFPLTNQVLSVGIESAATNPNAVIRYDNNGTFTWYRYNDGVTTYHIGEAFVESGTSTYRLWTPQAVRQFDSTVGGRRWGWQPLTNAVQLVDALIMHVEHVPERRVGVGILEPSGGHLWSTATIFPPAATGSPVTLTAGVNYAVIIRNPGGVSDYQSPGARFDWWALNDRTIDGTTFTHFGDLDWDLYSVKTATETLSISVSSNAEEHITRPQALDVLQSGLPTLRMITGSAQTVDTQPYSSRSLGVGPVGANYTGNQQAHQKVDMPGTLTTYRLLRVAMGYEEGASNPVDIEATIRTDAAGIAAGPFLITKDMWDESQPIGTNELGIPFREVLVDLGSSLPLGFLVSSGCNLHFVAQGDPNATFNPWSIGTLLSELAPITGSDQTALVSGSGGIDVSLPFFNLIWPPVAGVNRVDLQASLIAEPPPVTGISVTIQQQAVSGGTCDECPPTGQGNCFVRSIPYNRVCWSPTSLLTDQFAYYEVQRKEMAVTDAGVATDWRTIAIISPTGTPVTGSVPVSGVPNCYNDWSASYDSSVCYRVRQKRSDYSVFSRFIETSCITTPSPTGTDLIITVPSNPALNVAFSEAHTGALPITQEWEELDADQQIFRPMYGRDKFIGFRPLERLGQRFKRRVIISALCTPIAPCLNVANGLRLISEYATDHLVVRDRCGNRWYAGVSVPTITKLQDPKVGAIWLGDIVVTELTTPTITEADANGTTG